MIFVFLLDRIIDWGTEMETISSLKKFKIILAIISVALLSNCHTQPQAYADADADVLPIHIWSRCGLTSDTGFSWQIAEANTNSIQYINSSIKRALFSSDFLFGAGSSAMQIEGAAHEGGRGPGVWDDIVQLYKERFIDGDKFSTEIEHYYRYKEDVHHLKKLGIDSYRFSISWSRVLPDGTLKGGVNQEGIDFYNNLINELLANGITPLVTILHFDYPLALYQKFGGFLCRTIVKHFKDYSELLFKTYGDRVKHWTTINEAEALPIFFYMHGIDNKNAETCQTTKICKQAYRVLHNFILAHATVVQLYRKKFQSMATHNGEIGLVISAKSFVPYSSNDEDASAAQRLMDFNLGWILEPVFYGRYPKIMRWLVGNRLPKFTRCESQMIKGSIDFIGINYYTSHFARHEPNRTNINGSLDNYDALALTREFDAEGKVLGYKDRYGGNYVYPKGLYDVLPYLKQKYQNPKIYITENGIGSFKIPNPINDEHRIAYILSHLNATKAAIDNGVNVRGYFVWAAFDTFEFHDGYSGNWGLYHVDFNDNLKRIPKASAIWYKKLLTPKSGY